MPLEGDVIDALTRRLFASEPEVGDVRRAAVSIILKSSGVPSTLLIKRAERSGDPWSGQVAFPGGKRQPGDRTARETATRETREEVGIDLSRSAEFVGYSDVVLTHTGTMDVVPSVFLLKEEVEVKPNEEVASWRWVGIDELLSPRSRSTYEMRRDGRTLKMPALTTGDYVVWGLTHRIVTSLMDESRMSRPQS